MDVFNLQDFSAVNRRRCESPDGFDHSLHEWTLSDWMVAVGGEMGEAMNIAKKLNRVRGGRWSPRLPDRRNHGIPGNTMTVAELRAAFKREIGDVFIYLDLIAQSQGFDLAEVVRDTFNAKSAELGCPITYPMRKELLK